VEEEKEEEEKEGEESKRASERVSVREGMFYSEREREFQSLVDCQ